MCVIEKTIDQHKPGAKKMTATTENERIDTIQSIFESLDTNDPNTSMNLRDTFHTLWDQLHELCEHLQYAASKFDGNQKILLLEENRRVQTMMTILHGSYMSAIMPDEIN